MIGKRLAKQLSEQGYIITNFLDVRAREIVSLNGINVISLEEAQLLDDKSNYVVFVAVKNVFQHTEIVVKLRNIGFNYVVFKPLTILQNCNVSDELRIINSVYETVVEDEGYFKGKIPTCDGVNLVEMKDWGVIKELDNNIIAYVPVELLFTNINPDNEEWSEKNFLATYVALDMYRGINSRNSYNSTKLVNEYISKIALTGAKKMGLVVGEKWRQSVLAGRKDVYWHMKRKMSLQPDFFVDNCPYVTYKENRFILMSSGKNRISFLIEEGYLYIPVEMSRKDYISYLNINKAKEIFTLIERKQCEIFTAIPHPFFYYMDSRAPGYVLGWLKKIGKIISRMDYFLTEKNDFQNIKIIDALDDQGCSSRFLSNLGCRVIRILTGVMCIENLLYDLLKAEYIEQEDTDEDCDACLINSNVSNEKLIKKIVLKCNKLCFVQTIAEDEWLDKYLKKNDFPLRYLIYEDFWGSDLVHGYVYIKKDSGINVQNIIIE